MENNEKKSPWGKIFKLFGEFVIAALTAFFAASCVGRIM